MRFTTHAVTAVLLFCGSAQRAFAMPQPHDDIAISSTLVERAPIAEEVFADGNALVKRKGGGGGGGKGGSGGSSSSSSKGGSSSGSTSSTGRGSSTSNAGGSTKTGSGPSPQYGGGRYYGGGATTPYTAGRASPLGIAPVFFLGSALLFWPGIWLYGAYSYPYHNPYSFRNRTATNRTNSTNTPRDVLKPTYLDIIVRQSSSEGVNQTKPVLCFCAQYAVCGCDDDGNSTFLNDLVGDGDFSKLNKSVITVADVNGTSTILLNGTLPNGTTASGGTEDALGAAMGGVERITGYWLMVAIVGAMVYLV